MCKALDPVSSLRKWEVFAAILTCLKQVQERCLMQFVNSVKQTHSNCDKKTTKKVTVWV